MIWKKKNNESPGITAQKIICDLFNIDSTCFEGRYDEGYIEYMKPVIEKAFKEIKDTPIECTTFNTDYSYGSSRSPINFQLKSGKTLSVKTNWTTKNMKVAPPVVGQPGDDTFNYHFGHLYQGDIDRELFKEVCINKVDKMLPILMDYLFLCDYTLWIHREETDTSYCFKYHLIERKDIPDYKWEKDKLSFTSDLSQWNESTTLKYLYDHRSITKKLSLGEFQVHNNRPGYKFRFYMEELLNIISSMEFNNETLGMTAEKVVCDLFNLDYPDHLDERSHHYLAEQLKPIIESAFSKLPQAIEHTGSTPGQRGGQSKNKVDFILQGNKTLSLKTNWGKKVCPPEVGQPGKETFELHFNDLLDEELSDNVFKKLCITKTAKMMEIYLRYLFDCDYLLWVYYLKKDDTYQFTIVDSSKIKEVKWEQENFTFTRYLEEWNQSSTVKYNGVSLGEFQVHRHRNCYKFRFNMKNLLKLLKEEFNLTID